MQDGGGCGGKKTLVIAATTCKYSLLSKKLNQMSNISRKNFAFVMVFLVVQLKRERGINKETWCLSKRLNIHLFLPLHLLIILPHPQPLACDFAEPSLKHFSWYFHNKAQGHSTLSDIVDMSQLMSSNKQDGHLLDACNSTSYSMFYNYYHKIFLLVSTRSRSGLYRINKPHHIS
jgi:hypothetical protein